VRVSVIHGPNLNLLGQREPELYGRDTLAEVDEALVALGSVLGIEIATFQSNTEGELVDHIQRSGSESDGFLINAAGYTHTSVAIRDALLAVGRPFVEVHLSNPSSRERFRHRSLLADRAVGTVAGFGKASYLLGLRGLAGHLGVTARQATTSDTEES
jgi:3-dehydroquinate dehydratase-2